MKDVRIVLLDEGDVAEELDALADYLEGSGYAAEKIREGYSKPEDGNSRAWLVRWAVHDLTNTVDGISDVDDVEFLDDEPDPDEDEAATAGAASPVRRSKGGGSRAKCRGLSARGFATVR